MMRKTLSNILAIAGLIFALLVSFGETFIDSQTMALMVHHNENGINAFASSGLKPEIGWAYSDTVGQTETVDFLSVSFIFDADKKSLDININHAN